ncbi:MAPEG family protein [Planktotalea sp.]|uniref:MAPEG family protein n=1 Tax=Planktotalea sp. TaxID=2029877 RepID=UPI0032970792
MLAVTSIYAALITGIFLWLSLRVIQYRLGKRVSIGDEGHSKLQRRARAQANCAEYAPLGLLLMALLEIQGVPVLAMHVLGLMLLIGRALHAYGFSASPEIMQARRAGMILTLFMLTFSAIALLFYGLF